MAITIQEGRYYRRRDGLLVGPMIANGDLFYPAHTRYWNYDSRGVYKQSNVGGANIIAEVIVTEALPFELRAGGKYNTTKPDGSAGPVVTLSKNTFGHRVISPFQWSDGHGGLYLVLPDGLMRRYELGDELRITSEYIDPPPTPIERLESALKEIEQPLNNCYANKVNRFVETVKGAVAELKQGAK